ncbi:SDR family NAD(P)-dependent oxidoreductase [uncultured Sphingomonas sp.]|uniref:SDR family NAD(P)-dependent oxidoreductase n=1 Tax=uncultured Sphingomonas sp. TaxID=158754 RepID=UPI0035CA78CC
MTERRVAIVTGAGSGIGRALTHMLAADGCAVVALGRSLAPLETLREELAERAEIAPLAADVTEDDAPARAAALAVERFGRLDWLVNNAGVGKPLPVDETTDEILDFFLNVHLRAPFRFCREALARMADGGAIVNLASSFALIGGLRGGAYSAAKSGIIGLSKHMAAQYGPRGIRTNVVAPGVLETPMTAYAWDNARFQRMNFDMTPLNRTGTAEDAAHAIHFLLSDAARFINGQILAVDGGWTSTKFLAESAITARALDDLR